MVNNSLNSSELEILNNYQYRTSTEYDAFPYRNPLDISYTEDRRYNRLNNSHLLGIETKGGQKTLIAVKTQDVTRFNVFLSYFGLGKLGNIDLRLYTVNRYLLNKFSAEMKNKDNPNYQAYLTACRLAGAQMIYRKGTEDDNRSLEHLALWENLAQENQVLQVTGDKIDIVINTKGNPVEITNKVESKILLIWNAAATARHLKFLARMQGFVIDELYDEINRPIPANKPIGLEEATTLLNRVKASYSDDKTHFISMFEHVNGAKHLLELEKPLRNVEIKKVNSTGKA